MLLIQASSLVAADLIWQEGSGFRSAQIDVPTQGKSGFTLITPAQSSIVWTNNITDEIVARHYNMVSGGGVAAGDFDGDGLCDLYFCNRSGENGLFRNLGGWRFQNSTAQAGVACAGRSSTGATFADVNGDGLLDLLVNSFFGTNSCFLNAGDGRFTNAPANAGLLPRGGATSLALGDIDGDGDLDVYTAYFGIEAILREGGRISFGTAGGRPVVTGRHARRLRIVDGQLVELGEQDVLYLNDGRGRFSSAKWPEHFRDEDGKPISAAPMDFGLAVQIRDINEDGFPDIFVCNDFQSPDRAWLNDGTGRFRPIPRLALRNMSYASMGVDFADIDRDGRLDFITVDMLSREHTDRLRQSSSMPAPSRRIGVIDDREDVPRNALFWNRGDGTYAEIAAFSGVAASDWSWTPIFLDVDLDGFEDLLVSTGSLFDVMDRDAATLAKPGEIGGVARTQLSVYPRLQNPNAAFRNRGDLTFEDVSATWGFDARQVSHGMALADLDNDGDMDITINCANAAPLIYRNDSTAPRIAVRLKGLAGNSQGIGAKIKLHGGAVPAQSQEIISGGRYLSGDQAMRVFAAGAATNDMQIEVTWRSGRRSKIVGVKANRIYEIDESSATEALAPKSSEPPPIFEDVSDLLKHVHHEEPFDEPARQPLLPRSLSQPGPAVAWFDYDADGDDDLLLGSGRGGVLAIFQNDGSGAFQRVTNVFDSIAPDDFGGIVAASLSANQRTIVAALGNYESTTNNPAALRFDIPVQTTKLPPSESCSGPLALGDVDRDGDLDLFIGGRVIPGRYPEAASSRVFRNEKGQFQHDEDRSRAFANVGLVNGAIFSDINSDGHADLLLACDWGPIRVFLNDNGELIDATEKLGLAIYVGWWNGVTTGDFDNDGRMDIVASNWGRNTRYEHARSRPLRLYYGDLDANGTFDILEASFEPTLNRFVPQHPLDVMTRAFPDLGERVKTHKAYAQAGVEQLFGPSLQNAKRIEAYWLESTLFLNRGDRFEPRRLPREVQFAPAFGVSVGDFNGDGNEDIFLAQNFFANLHGDSRYDAGRSLWLQGDGAGNFAPVLGQESGVKVYGEQRACAVSDFDHDGRLDLVVTQNGAATKLYRNTRSKPGLRVRLEGPATNPDAIGAAVRLYFGDIPGPVREVCAGGGYWSQDSFVQILGAPQTPTRVWVRWPGGKFTFKDVPANAREIKVSAAE